MTTNKEARYRIEALMKKAQELEEKGYEKTDGYVIKILKTYHNQWFVTSHATQRQDLITVLDRVYKDE